MKGLFYLPVRVEAKNHEVLFWGCTHYRHNPKWELPIWKRRGYESSAEHDEGIVLNWNSKATEKTVGFLLGDVMFGYGGEEEFIKLMNRLNFWRVFVMSGNHHAGWKQTFENLKDNTLYLDKCRKEVIFVPNYLEAYVNGQPIVMCHYPIVSWNGHGKGSWMLHSHCHGSLYGTEIGNILYKAKIADVGVERHAFPATFGEIKSKFNKDTIAFDHHNSKTENPF